MGNSVSRCGLCEKSFSTNELVQLQLCARDYDYFVRFLNGDSSRGSSKGLKIILILVSAYGSYCLWKYIDSEQLNLELQKSEQKIKNLQESGEIFRLTMFSGKDDLCNSKENFIQ